MPTIILNDQPVTVPPGATLLAAARSAGLDIPTLCHHADLSATGSCRVCLVEVAGFDRLLPACTQPCIDGLRATTDSPRIRSARRFVLQLLVGGLGDDAQLPETSEFATLLRQYDIPLDHRNEPVRHHVVDSDPNPFLRVDWNLCIHCTRCIRACHEVQGRHVWHLAHRGHALQIVAGNGTSLLLPPDPRPLTPVLDARCESCGACAAYCPTGALSDRMSHGQPAPDRHVTTTCGYCGVGCQFDLNVRNDRVIGVTSRPDAPVNGMSLCVKGRYGYDFLHHADRLTQPRVRAYLLDGQPKPAGDRGPWVDVDWEPALDLVADRWADIDRTNGPGSIAVLSSAKCTNEENYLAQKFARQVLGTHDIDHCARLCHSSTVAGLAMCYGSGAMSNSLDDVAEHAAALFIIGSNTTEQHPVFGAMLRQAVLRRGVPLVVADPRKIDIAEFATLHLRHRPGSDITLLNGLMHLIVARDGHNRDFIAARCEGFDDFAASLAPYRPPHVAAVTGVAESQLRAAADIFAEHHPLAVIWAMGITQHTTGVLNVLALGNLQMLLGNLGVPGGGVNPLRGQNNVQGACDLGALPNVFPGYQSVADSALRDKFAAAWATVPSRPLPTIPGRTVTELIADAGRGVLRSLYIVGEDPAMTEPDSHHARASLAATELVVLQEIFPSETSPYADVLLPAAAFAEKDGTFTNTERRVQLVRQAIPPPGAARPDWQIIADLAQRLLARQGRAPTGPCASWSYAAPRDILAEAARLTPSYAGISHARLERGERLQWPVPSDDHSGTPILHVDQFTRGRGLFHAVDQLPPDELPDAEYPLLLTTGRVLYHWHGGELTRRAAGLVTICPAPQIEISPEDAARHNIAPDQPLRLTSRRGSCTAQAQVTPRVPPGVLFANFHFPGAHNANNTTNPALDPTAKIPAYKIAAVRIEPTP